MLRTLLESNAAPTRRRGGMLVSIGLHTAVIALAVTATARATVHRDPVEKTSVIAMLPPAPPRTEHRTKVEHSPPQQRCCFEIPIQGTIVVAPVKTPDHLPVIDLGHPPSQDDFCIDCARRDLRRTGEPVGPPTSPNDVYSGTTVEKAAIPRADNPAPVYPPALRSSQIEGSVTARFIVDTAGRAEPSSIVVEDATHPLFGDAVRQALLRSRYEPAMVANRKVRQLVEQRFTFTLLR